METLFHTQNEFGYKMSHPHLTPQFVGTLESKEKRVNAEEEKTFCYARF